MWNYTGIKWLFDRQDRRIDFQQDRSCCESVTTKRQASAEATSQQSVAARVKRRWRPKRMIVIKWIEYSDYQTPKATNL